MLRRGLCWPLVLGCALLWGSPAAAGPLIEHDDRSGTNVDFIDIDEQTLSIGDPDEMWFQPEAAGDTLFFPDISFVSTVTGAGGNDLTDGRLRFTVMAKEGQFIDLINIKESGTFSLVGIGTAATEAEVTAFVNFQILEVAGVPTFIQVTNVPMVFTPSDGDYNLADDGSGSGGWTGELDFDPTTTLLLNSLPDLATKIRIVLDNKLATMSEDGTTAFIDKKTASNQITAFVPEPGTAGLLALGLVALAARRRGLR